MQRALTIGLATITLLIAITSSAVLAVEDFAVSGKVLAKGERKGVEGAAVFMVDQPDIPPAITDENGAYTVDLPGPGDYQLVAVMVGYIKPKPVTVFLTPGKNKATVNLYIHPVNKLTEIVIDADRVESRVGKTVISGEELKRVPGSGGDPMRGTHALPGVTSGGGSQAKPAVRGSSAYDNVYYVDFAPYNEVFHIGDWVSIFHPDLVEDFNIFLSAAGPEYQSALGGVFDIKLRDPRTDRYAGNVAISMAYSDMIVEGPVTDDQAFYFAARRSYIDVLLEATGVADDAEEEDISIIQFPYFWDITGKYVWRINRDHKFSFLTITTGDAMEMRIGNKSEIAEEEPLLVGLIDNTWTRYNNSLTLASAIGSSLNNQMALYRWTLIADENVAQIGSSDGTFTLTGFRDQLKWRVTDSHTLTIGGNVELMEVDISVTGHIDWGTEFDPEIDYSSAPERTLTSSFEAMSYAGFLSDRWKVTDKLTVAAGARYYRSDYLDTSGLLPSATVEFDATEALLLMAGWGRYAQFPDAKKTIEVFGNPDLDFEKSESLSLGGRLKLGAGWSVKTEAYYKTFTDLVSPVEDERNFINGGEGEAWGAELLIQKERTSTLSGWLSIAYSKTERTNTLTGEVFDASFDRPLVINLVAEYQLYSWTVSGRWRYQSGSPYTPVVGTYEGPDGRVRPIYGAIGEERLPDFHQLDLRAERDFRFDTWKFTFFLEVFNAYDQENVTGYNYNVDYTEKTKNTGMPFLPFIGIEATF